MAVGVTSAYIRASGTGGFHPMSRAPMAAEKEVTKLTDERRKALNLAITQIEKTCGKGAIMRIGAVDVVVVDSVAALVPKAEIEGEMGDSLPGLQARLMSQALRKLAGAINRSRTAVVFINQLREKIGIMFGNPETTSGGRALKFYASVRLDMRRTGPAR